jgi:hypothetical protein
MSPMSPRLLRPRSTGFNPKSISGLVLWLDPTDSSTYTISTGVSAWNDKSGGSRNFAQSTGNNQPALSTINGKTAFSFNGTSHFLSSSSTLLTGNGAATLFMVVEGTFTGTDAHLFNHNTAAGGADSNQISVQWRADQGSAWVFGTLRTRVKSLRSGTAYNADQRFDSVDVSGRGAVTAEAGFNASSATNVSRWRGTASPSASGTSDAGAETGMSIGCRNNSTRSLFYAGRVGEVIAYNRALTTAERNAIQSYLARKWGYTTT